jgi:hypothetical protein
MARRATTFRLDPDLQAGLALLSKVQGLTQNQLVNDAVRALLAKRARDVSVDLESTLARLRAHRRADPTGEKSMTAAMQAEAALEHDPAEGVRVQRGRASRPVTARMLKRLRG